MTVHVLDPATAKNPVPARAAPAPMRPTRTPAAGHELHAVEAARASGGVPMPVSARVDHERWLGADFAAVRLHRGARPDSLAVALDATAFTIGTDVFLHSGAPDPATPAGRGLLAHELVHVLQQADGPVAASRGPGGLLVSHPGDRHERAAAELVERGRGMGARRSVVTPSSGTVIQRQSPLGVVPAPPVFIPPPPLVVPPAPVGVDGFTVPWAGSAGATGESIALRLGLHGARTVGQGLVTAGGTVLGEGVVVAGSGVAGAVVTEGAAVVTGTVLAEGAVALGTAAVAPGAAVVIADSAVILGSAAVVTTGEAATLATAATGAALITPVGWIVIGVVVVAVGVGVAVYLLTREPPKAEDIVPVQRTAGATRGTGKGSMAPPVRAPGLPGGARVQEPDRPPPIVVPGAGGMSPVTEPARPAPAVMPGAGPGTPLQAAGPLEGRTNVLVDDRRTGKRITDIDKIEDDTLWEEKSAVSAPDINAWVDLHITQKCKAYVEARKHPPLFPYYENAPIGFEFEYAVSL